VVCHDILYTWGMVQDPVAALPYLRATARGRVPLADTQCTIAVLPRKTTAVGTKNHSQFSKSHECCGTMRAIFLEAIMRKNTICVLCLGIVTIFSFRLPETRAQEISKLDRERALTMLKEISSDIQKHYYDPNFHGLDWKATVAKATQEIEHANSLNMAMADIAQALVSLNDSHTFLLPPPRPYILNYGFQYQMIGDHCYIMRARPATDAETKGVKPGDELLAVDGYPPSRANLWEMRYRFTLLRPELGLRLTLRDLQGNQRQVDVAAKVHQTERLRDLTGEGIWDFIRQMEAEEHEQRVRRKELGDRVTILKIPAFFFDESEAYSMIKEARKRPGLIVDLRGDPGGSIESLRYLVGGLFDKEIKIADRQGRKKLKPEVSKSIGSHAYRGKLVVLVDSESASAAELFARVVQLEKRGIVIGDRTSGSVMEAKHYSYQLGMDTIIPFGASITEADLIMSDGKSLEHTGVIPDEVLLPTAADLAAGRDPVLARAAEMLGARLTAEEAGKLFPYEWPAE